MNLENWREKAFILAMIGSIQSFILIPAAMLFYAGGTVDDPTAPGFSLWTSFLSDLGRLTAYSGLPNLVSALLFNVSLFLMGAFLIPYFLAVPYFFRGLREARWFSIAGSAIGIFMALTFIGGSLTPSDTLLRPIHLTFGVLGFMSCLPIIILYTFAIFENRAYPNRYAFTFMALGAISLVFLLLMIQGADSGDMAAIFTAGQKVAVASILLCFLIQAYGAWKLHKSWDDR
ncbi:MAG: DUF998 domain-containing protein [Candidatus Hermodarchaeota archaeon]